MNIFFFIGRLLSVLLLVDNYYCSLFIIKRQSFYYFYFFRKTILCEQSNIRSLAIIIQFGIYPFNLIHNNIIFDFCFDIT